MVVGTTLLMLDNGVYYSPSFPRAGLAGTFAVDVTNYEGLTSFGITVQHRDEHDTTWTTAGTFSSISATGPASLDVTGLKQIIRFMYVLEGSHPDGVHFIMQAPSWRPYP